MSNGERGGENRIRRLRKPLRIPIGPGNYDYLKENGINASRIMDKAIIELKSAMPHELIIILQKGQNNGPAEIRTQDLRRVKATS